MPRIPVDEKPVVSVPGCTQPQPKRAGVNKREVWLCKTPMLPSFRPIKAIYKLLFSPVIWKLQRDVEGSKHRGRETQKKDKHLHGNHGPTARKTNFSVK